MATNPKIFYLDNRHIMRDERIWKSVADRYMGSYWRLKPDVEDWLAENDIEFNWGKYRDATSSHHQCSIYIDNPKEAMLFKLVWM